MSLKRRMKRAAELGRSGPPPPRRAYGHEIFYVPIREAWHEALPPAAKAAIPRLHRTLLDRSESPLAAIRELEGLVEHHPHAPVFYNFLNIAYGRAGEDERRRALIVRCRAALPDYLFGTIAQAELLLDEEDYDGFAELWGGVFDLREHYPERTQFHVSEFAGFYGIIGLFHQATGNDAEARRLRQMLMDVAPDEGATKALHDRVHRRELEELLEVLNPENIARLLELDPLDEPPRPA
jgi:hypothetical protein